MSDVRDANAYLRNCWYALAWSHEVDTSPVGREVLGEPIVLYRGRDGAIRAFEDRCPHRHAPLSLGRVEGDHLRCMYHGLLFDQSGKCLSVPGSTVVPSARLRPYPAVEQDGWIWVWPGKTTKALPALIPRAFGLDDPAFTMRSGQIEYAANYELINDNLCDLSHVDFVHEATLGLATGYGWSDATGRVTVHDRHIRIERWLSGRPAGANNPRLVDTWNTYDYHVPGVFVMESWSYAHGMAKQCRGKAPVERPMTRRVEQQAVTPLDARRTRYLFATGFETATLPERLIEPIFETVMAAFVEDRLMIEAQQRIWDRTPPGLGKTFIEHDKGPHLFRRLLKKLIAAEEEAGAAG